MCCKHIFQKLITRDSNAYLTLNFRLNQKLSAFILKFIKTEGRIAINKDGYFQSILENIRL